MNKKTKIKNGSKWVGNYKATIRDAETGDIKRVKQFHNVVLLQFREYICKLMAKEVSDGERIGITHEQLGYDNTPADEDQTGLIDPEPDTKKLIASLDCEGDTIKFLSFWDEGQAIGEWREFALIADDDFAVVRANVELDVSGGETLTIDGEIRQQSGSGNLLSNNE